jgi:hypothetical protein
MPRALLLTAAIGLTAIFTARQSLALDTVLGAGVASRGRPAHVTAGGGMPTDQGLARPGFSSKVGSGSVGVTRAGSGGSTGPSTAGGFHAAGVGKPVTASRGQSTMDVVPGKAPAFFNHVSGKRLAPDVGARAH